MRIRPSSYFLMGILACTLFFGLYSLTYPKIQTKLLPLVISGIVFVLAAVELTRELRASKAGKEAAGGFKGITAEDRRELLKYLFTFCWIGGLLLGIYLIGFLPGIFLFILAYLRFHAHHRWPKSVIVATVALAFIYGIFVVIFKADLFPGLLFGG